MAAGGVAVAALGLERHGVALPGSVPAGFPALALPESPGEHLPALAARASGLALVLFSSGLLTARQAVRAFQALERTTEAPAAP